MTLEKMSVFNKRVIETKTKVTNLFLLGDFEEI